MNCEQAVELLTGSVDQCDAAERRRASEHAAACADCRGAVMSVHALRLASLAPPGEVPRGSFERMMQGLEAGAANQRQSGGRFWLGAAAGAAMAASLALAVGIWWLRPAGDSATAATPRLSLALNESRDISIALTTAAALTDAEIHLSLSGAIGLAGYYGQRQINWRTDLDAGANQLTLPIVATGIGGGQVLVEVVHSGRRRSFVVDVEAEATTPEVI